MGVGEMGEVREGCVEVLGYEIETGKPYWDCDGDIVRFGFADGGLQIAKLFFCGWDDYGAWHSEGDRGLSYVSSLILIETGEKVRKVLSEHEALEEKLGFKIEIGKLYQFFDDEEWVIGVLTAIELDDDDGLVFEADGCAWWQNIKVISIDELGGF